MGVSMIAYTVEANAPPSTTHGPGGGIRTDRHGNKMADNKVLTEHIIPMSTARHVAKHMGCMAIAEGAVIDS